MSNVAQYFEDAGYDVSGYSGRFMYGKECLGVSCDDAIKAILDAVRACAEYGDDVIELIDNLANFRTDSLGLGEILYFPSVEWNEHGVNDEDEEELEDEDATA